MTDLPGREATVGASDATSKSEAASLGASGRETTPKAAYEALVQVGREALREAGAGPTSTYEEDARAVLNAVLPLVADALCIDWSPPRAEQGPCLCPPFSCECEAPANGDTRADGAS